MKKKLDTVKKCKDRIQKLLHDIVVTRDKGCILKGKYRACSGPLTADHIVTRGRSRTYGMVENVVCVCAGHHIWWKPINPTLYTNEIDNRIGKEQRLWLEEIARSITKFSLRDWQLVEDNLKEELKSYKERS